MLSKHQIATPISGYGAVTRRIGLLAVLLVGFAANAYAKDKDKKNDRPEIAVGAGISAFVLAGGGLLLLADRLRGKKKSKS